MDNNLGNGCNLDRFVELFDTYWTPWGIIVYDDSLGIGRTLDLLRDSLLKGYSLSDLSAYDVLQEPYDECMIPRNMNDVCEHFYESDSIRKDGTVYIYHGFRGLVPDTSTPEEKELSRQQRISIANYCENGLGRGWINWQSRYRNHPRARWLTEDEPQVGFFLALSRIEYDAVFESLIGGGDRTDPRCWVIPAIILRDE